MHQFKQDEHKYIYAQMKTKQKMRQKLVAYFFQKYFSVIDMDKFTGNSELQVISVDLVNFASFTELFVHLVSGEG